MKKIMFFAIAAAGLFASCTSDDNFDAGAVVEQNVNDGLVPIQIGVGKVASVQTRGTGTVGSLTDSADNVWNKQIVNVFMFKKDSLRLALTDLSDPTPLYNDVTFFTPDGVLSNRAIDLTNAVKYYPTTDKFDFWGYRLDDAVRLDTIAGINRKDSTRAVLPFRIDGSQDVMVAKAVPSHDDTLALGTDKVNRAYSAYAARNNVQPNLEFKHLLTRLSFKIIAGNNEAMDPTTGIFVDSISIESKTTGKLIVAYTPKDTLAAMDDTTNLKNRIIWDNNIKSELFLKQRAEHAVDTRVDSLNLVKLDSIQPNSTTVGRSVGEALLVAPDNSYKIKVYMHQYKPTSEGGQNVKKMVFTAPDVVKINTAGTEPFKRGYSYEVLIKLYGLSPIEVTTTLTGWMNGGTIEITPEDDAFNEQN
jgi:hypothetical protein